MGGARASGGSGIESGSVGGVLGITVPGAPGSGMGCEGSGMLSRPTEGPGRGGGMGSLSVVLVGMVLSSSISSTERFEPVRRRWCVLVRGLLTGTVDAAVGTYPKGVYDAAATAAAAAAAMALLLLLFVLLEFARLAFDIGVVAGELAVVDAFVGVYCVTAVSMKRLGAARGCSGDSLR